LDDFGEPRWKGRLIAEPRDYEVLIGLTHKHNSLEKARAVLARIAANNVEFHKGHSQLAELLVAGQAAACFTCYSHHYPARKKKGAPVDYMLSEGAAGIIAVAVLKNAPHPNTAWLFTRWAASEEGQAVTRRAVNAGPPKVEPTEPIRPKDLRGRGGGPEAIYQV
jgi:iron(III) transport system substrate-binding protein